LYIKYLTLNFRAQLAAEWRQKQDDIKNEEILVVYSYWDGKGHRRQVRQLHIPNIILTYLSWIGFDLLWP